MIIYKFVPENLKLQNSTKKKNRPQDLRQ